MPAGLPRQSILGPEELPGQSYDAIRQCRLAFGAEYTVCPGMDVCARLWCAVIRQGQMVCLTKKLPAVEGTPCGKGRICLHGKCVDKTRKKQYTTSNHGSWSKRAIYRSCNVSPCPEPSKSFRLQQCEARNGPQTDPKGVKTFVEWVPKFAGVLPGDVCKLTCRAKGTGYYVVFSQRVTDGTECRPYSSSVCVKGKCVRTGCDGIIGSKLQFDKCGICGGDSTSCVKVMGNFTKKSKGYTDVVKIPEGSTHIKIRQHKPKDQLRFTAYLALRRAAGDYLLNGKFMISTSETVIPLSGMVLNYSGWSQRDDFLHSMGPGALREQLTVQILATDAKRPLGVRYSFFAPRQAAPPRRRRRPGDGRSVGHGLVAGLLADLRRGLADAHRAVQGPAGGAGQGLPAGGPTVRLQTLRRQEVLTRAGFRANSRQHTPRPRADARTQTRRAPPLCHPFVFRLPSIFGRHYRLLT
ncbi:hypothetical protein ANANG_G00275760 [Anguilla anguilla]|uniref:ADAM cysteine-rich domain-containing protein n=1 Tax=Anguilla anguilla TaxID=7936 RepID=A0A9D3LLW5_ANGAN|nr:hypothetical protein ANANG_G00275760 [Anguilla anguilla]